MELKTKSCEDTLRICWNHHGNHETLSGDRLRVNVRSFPPSHLQLLTLGIVPFGVFELAKTCAHFECAYDTRATHMFLCFFYDFFECFYALLCLIIIMFYFLAGGFWEARGMSSLDGAAPQCQSDTHANEALA